MVEAGYLYPRAYYPRLLAHHSLAWWRPAVYTRGLIARALLLALYITNLASGHIYFWLPRDSGPRLYTPWLMRQSKAQPGVESNVVQAKQMAFAIWPN